MKTAKYSLFGFRVIILHEMDIDSLSKEISFAVGFHEKSSVISENLWLDNETIFDIGFSEIESHII
jgi:hypothetical protein